MKWSRWTPETHARLIDLYFAGHGAKEIAAMLGRTEHSVRLRLLNSSYSSRRIKTAGDLPQAAVSSKCAAEEFETDAGDYQARARAEMELQQARREERGKIEEVKRQLVEDRIVAEFTRQLRDLPRTPLRVVAPKAPSRDLGAPANQPCFAGEVAPSRKRPVTRFEQRLQLACVACGFL